MGALRTSEDGDEVVGGEAKAVKSDDNRAVDAPGRIIIDSAPLIAPPVAAPIKKAAPVLPPAAAPQKSGGLGLVVFVYIVAIAALGAAIYERFFLHA